MTEQEARDDEREALIREVTREIADRVGYQRLSVDLVRGIVREWDARKHPEPEITEEMVKRAVRATWRPRYGWTSPRWRP